MTRTQARALLIAFAWVLITGPALALLTRTT